MPSIKINDVTFTYNNIQNPVLQDFTWSKTTAANIALLGTNGSGKSTLLRLISGFLIPSKGNIQVCGKKVNGAKSVKRVITFVPENAKLFLMGPTPRRDLLRINGDEDYIIDLYLSYNLDYLLDKKLYHLSEGQRRLIALLHAFQLPNKVILLDEPTIGLDQTGRKILVQLLEQAKQQQKIVLVASNDTRLFCHMDQLLVLKNTQPFLFGSTREILYRLIEQTDLLPNQIVCLVDRLKRKYNIEMPKIINTDEFNAYLQEGE